MGWETIKYACGHTDRKQMYGAYSARSRAVEAAECHECPACRAAAVQTEAEKAGLPTLVGSEKQIAWAGEIRERALRLLDSDRTEKIRDEKSAKWWIENRGSLVIPTRP